MSRYKKSNKKRNSRNATKSIIMTVVCVLLIMAVLGGAAALFRSKDGTTVTVTDKPGYSVTTEDITLCFAGNDLVYDEAYGGYLPSEYLPAVSMYCLDKTGNKEAAWIGLINYNPGQVWYGDVPAGYTHIVFVVHASSDDEGSFDDAIYTSEELLIPMDENICYIPASDTWITFDTMHFN